MKIKLIVVGKTRETFLQEGEQKFQHRLSRFCQLDWVIVKEEKISPGKNEEHIKIRESERIMEKLPESAFLIVLDRTGELMSSEGLATLLHKKMNEGCGEIVFVIGGALGLTDNLLKSASKVLSLSPMTFTHEMSRLILLEQLYRAFTILRGEKYHKN